MAAATKTADPFSKISDVTVEDAKSRIPRKGRNLSETTVRIIESLNHALETGNLKAIPCEDEATYKDLERKIRSAAKQIPMKVTVRRGNSGELLFGPEEVFKAKSIPTE